MTLHRALDRWARDVGYTPPAAAEYDAGGNAVTATAQPTAIRATVRPISGRELRDLPEGVRIEAKSVAWSRTPLHDDGRMTVAGRNYRLIATRDNEHEGGFWRAVLVLLK